MSDPQKFSSPVVIVTASLASPLVSQMISDALTGEAQNVMDRLRALGAEVRFVEASEPQMPARELLSNGVAGLLVLGGADIDPALYGQQEGTDALYGVNRAADEFEASLISTAIDQKLPVFGICRGLQLINVVHGGTLIQDLGKPTIHTASSDNAVMACHEIKIQPGRRLASILGTEQRQIMSGHHQAIGRLGKGLCISAIAEDGVVEAVEYDNEAVWLLGVQWHPEEPSASVEELDRLLNAFLAACSKNTALSR